ncbi:hypothetical protein LIG30_2716 [Burkholderia sp. lig30]|jgi:predicted porin|uniref:porin n=1 Tax=Burkholderia sp. lig30 TaxID=1192124 RepID=UPI000460C0DA|nr:porin [Burkholderia sp. lig30]KDB08192.1 hypothetical protein LIG30_2716 [Burkholderia sp. lig30]
MLITTRKLLPRVCSVAALIASLPAHAQSSVTLYGVLDAGLLYMSKTATPGTNVNAGKYIGFADSGYSPSLFGLAGVEDLGGGLKAEFKLESGINLGTGGYNNSNGNLWGRQAWLALDSDKAGRLKLGLQFSPFFESLFDLDPRLSLTGSTLLPYLNNVAGTGIFTPNAVSYTSPTFYGLQGSVMYAFGNQPGDMQAGRQVSARLKYDAHNLLVEAAYYDANPGGAVQTVPPTDVPFEGRMIGFGYTFEKLTVKASFTNYKVKGSGNNNNVYGIGASYMATPTLNLNGATYYEINRNDSSSHALWGIVGASYFLSKRTTLYSQVGVISNKGGMRQGMVTGENAPPANSLFLPEGTAAIVNLGIRHTF